jgi:predicted extracellular nuclease
VDGAGNCDLTRTRAAQALGDWLKTDPTGSGDPDVLVIGDLNSYKREAPITALEDAGFTDLIERFGGEKAYGYLFDGQLGYLDHALASASLAAGHRRQRVAHQRRRAAAARLQRHGEGRRRVGLRARELSPRAVLA